MKRVAATSAYVRSWLPTVWKRALQRLLHFLLRLSMFPRRLLMLEPGTVSVPTTPSKRRWLRLYEPTDGGEEGVNDETYRDNHWGVEEEDAVFFAADVAAATASSSRGGLANLGNTCFVNAVVQCLLAIPGFVERLEDEVLRVLAHERGEGVPSGRRTRGSEDRETHTTESQLLLAQTLLDLLQGLMPEEVDTEERNESTVDSVESTDAIAMNGKASAHVTNPQDDLRNERETSPVAKTPRTSQATTGKKRKRPMKTGPSDFSAAATTKRLKSFLQAASKCSDLVSADTRRQGQQDAEELLLFLLDSLHELLRWKPAPLPSTNGSAANRGEDSRSGSLAELSRLVALENECLKKLTRCVVTDPGTYNTTVSFLGDVRWNRYLTEHSSFITEMFTGQIVRGSQCCSCANLTCLHQEFRVLSLSVDPSQASQTLEHCLESHRRLEDLVADNQVFCDGHCQDKTSRRTQVLLQRAPQTLVIQLQRFKQTNWQANAEKVAASVEFPIDEPLDLTINMFLRDPSTPIRYQLQAVCAHIGSSLDAGHYIAYTRDASQSGKGGPSSVKPSGTPVGWTKFDDDFVTTLDAGTLRSETKNSAYMLFYTIVEPDEIEDSVEDRQQQDEHGEVDSNSIEDDDNI